MVYIKTKLRDYQRRIGERIGEIEPNDTENESNNVILYSPYGSGKTLAALYAAEIEKEKYPNRPIMVISPHKDLSSQWGEVLRNETNFKFAQVERSRDIEEAVKYNPDIIILQPRVFSNIIKKGKLPKYLENPSLIIFDEARSVIAYSETPDGILGFRTSEVYSPIINTYAGISKMVGLTGALDSSDLIALERILDAKTISPPEEEVMTHLNEIHEHLVPVEDEIIAGIYKEMEKEEAKAVSYLTHGLRISPKDVYKYAWKVIELNFNELDVYTEEDLKEKMELEKIGKASLRMVELQILKTQLYEAVYYGQILQAASRFKESLPDVYNSIESIIGDKKYEQTGKTKSLVELLSAENVFYLPLNVEVDREFIYEDLLNQKKIVFTRLVKTTEHLSKILGDEGISSVHLNGKMELERRDAIIDGFKSHLNMSLVTTNVLHEGMDFPGVIIINFGYSGNAHAAEQRKWRGRGGDVYSFYYVGTSEKSRLDNELKMFEKIKKRIEVV